MSSKLTKTFTGLGTLGPPEVPVLEKRPAPRDGTVEAAVEVVIPPRPSVNPVAPGCCGAVDVRMEPKLKPAPVVEEVVVVSEKGVADAVGLLKAKLKPVAADVVAGAPKRPFT